tara:strand:+ start:372 stop:518 length:147 start_codon:yes stop_codon:yes gene_type:complete
MVFVVTSGCARDLNFNPVTTLLNQIIKGKYDAKRVGSLETFKEKHPRN